MHRSLQRDESLIPHAFFAALLIHTLVVLLAPGLREIHSPRSIRILLFPPPPAVSAPAIAPRRTFAPSNLAVRPAEARRPTEIATDPQARVFRDPMPSAYRDEPSYARTGFFSPQTPAGVFAPRGEGDDRAYFATREEDENGRGGSPGVEMGSPDRPADTNRRGGTPTSHPAPMLPEAGRTGPRDAGGPPSSPDSPEEELPGRLRRRKLMTQILPEYPAWAEEQRIEAQVVFDITVAETGRVKGGARLVRTSGFTELDHRAESAVRGWVYEPVMGYEEIRRVIVLFRLRSARGR